MAWKTVATVVIVVFAIVLTQMVVAGPVENVETSLNETGDYSNEHFDGNEFITSTLDSWYNMGLIAIGGLMFWGTVFVIRKELTRRRGGL
jgi:hypothetical protein